MRIRLLQLLLLIAAVAATAFLVGSRASISADAQQEPEATTPIDAPQDPSLPADATTARDRLAKSPRHGEWAVIHTGTADSVRAWVVYPERAERAPVVLVVHEVFGLTHWIRAVADQLAADGFIAIAPDLMTANGLPADSTGEPVREQATAAIRTLEPRKYHQQLIAVAEWGMRLPAATSRYGIVGFCWGGAASFGHAAASPKLGASVVYYGTSPAAAELTRVTAPMLGLYGSDDARVNASVPPAEAEMKRLNRTYEVHTFEGAGHGFLRQQEGREGANLRASRSAWPLTVQFFRKHLQS